MSTEVNCLQFSYARWPIYAASPPGETLWIPDEWKKPCGIPEGGDGRGMASDLALTQGRESCSSLAQLSKAYGPITAPLANSQAPSVMMPTCSRAQHSEKSRTPNATQPGHFDHNQGKTPLKSRILYSHNCVRKLDNWQRVAISPSFSVNHVKAGVDSYTPKSRN